MNIERSDRTQEPMTEEIRRDWRAWATGKGYLLSSTIPVKGTPMILELWEHPSAEKDAHLLYLPDIPHTTGGETLYTITHRKELKTMVDTVQRMAEAAAVLAKAKWEARKAMLN